MKLNYSQFILYRISLASWVVWTIVSSKKTFQRMLPSGATSAEAVFVERMLGKLGVVSPDVRVFITVRSGLPLLQVEYSSYSQSQK